MRKTALIRVLCMLAAAAFALSAGPAAAEETAAPRPKPTVRPLAIEIDYSLPHTQVTEENLEQYFNLDLGKEYSRGKKLSIPYTVSPKEPYDQYAGSSPGVYFRLEISVFLHEGDEEPFYTKRYVVMLRREKGYVDSGVIDALIKVDQDDVFYTYSIYSCNGRIGLDGWEPEPEPETETEDADPAG